MANKSLFASLKSRFVRADTRNEAGGRADTFEPKHALAQLAATGCFNGTYYAEADEQLATLKTLVDQVGDNAFLAKLAVYSRQRAMMKDMPVALLLALSKRDPALFRQVFDRVVDNGRTRRHAGAVRSLGPVWPQGPVVLAPAGCVLVSDQESWVCAGRGGSTAVVTQWQEFVKNQMRLGGHGIPSPKLICIDLQPYTTTQAPDRGDILNVGGFSDAVFSVVAAFLADDVGRFVAEVDSVEL